MATLKAERSIRLLGRTTAELDRISGLIGEIFYDTSTQSLRVFSTSASSSALATREWVTANSPQSDWNQATSTAADFIKNKPTLFNGTYASLTGKPTLFTGSYTDLTNKPTIPTNNNQLTNGAGYITTNGIPNQTSNSGKYLTTDGSALSWGTVTASTATTATNLAGGNSTTLLGAIGYQSNTNTTTLLSPNTTATKKFLRQTGNGTNGAAPAWDTVTATDVGLGNVTNESKATMFASPTFTGTVAGVTATHVGLGNVTNESKATMFASPTFTGTVAAFSSATHTLTGSSNLVFTGSTSGTVTFSAGTTPASQTYTLPAAYPSVTGYALVSTTAGVLSWAAAGGGGGGTTTNALTIGGGLTGTSFNGSAAVTVALDASGVVSGTYGSSTVVPVVTIDSYGRVTNVSTITVSGQFKQLTVGASTIQASSTSGAFSLVAGTNVTLSANTGTGAVTINSSGGAAAGITWSTNTTSSGNITVTNPTGYNTSGSTMVIVVVGMGATSASASSGSGTFSTAFSVGSNTRVIYGPTTSSLASTTTISGISGGYAMAYAYISGGAGISTGSTSSTSTSANITAPSPNSGSPRIFAVSMTSSLNLATVASTASGGGPTWASGSGYQHPLDATLSATIWVGTGSWTTSATPTVSSNSGFYSWYVTGITTTS